MNCESILHVAFKAVLALNISHTNSGRGMWQSQVDALCQPMKKNRARENMLLINENVTLLSFYIKYQFCMQTGLINQTQHTGMKALCAR